METAVKDNEAMPFLEAAQHASGARLGNVVMAPSNQAPVMNLRPPALSGFGALGSMTPAAKSFVAIGGAALVGGGIGLAASRGDWRGAGIGAGLQVGIASLFNVMETRGYVTTGVHVGQGLVGLLGLAGAGYLLFQKPRTRR